MKTISELRLEGDARVSIHDMNRFEAAILGGRGDLDAWLECNNEEEVRLHIGKLLHLCVADLQHENQSLRTKIEAVEQQVPYCWTTSPPSGHYSRFNPEVDRWIENGWTVVPLYALPGAQPAPSIPSEEAAAEMGANGGHVVEAERLAFEAWMRGHCWKLGAKWTGTEYRSAFEKGGMVDMHAMRTRELWAAWRDRAALAAAPEAKP